MFFFTDFTLASSLDKFTEKAYQILLCSLEMELHVTEIVNALKILSVKDFNAYSLTFYLVNFVMSCRLEEALGPWLPMEHPAKTVIRCIG